jgi:hypothetical protein
MDYSKTDNGFEKWKAKVNFQIQRALQCSLDDLTEDGLRTYYNAGVGAEAMAHKIIKRTIIEASG